MSGLRTSSRVVPCPKTHIDILKIYVNMQQLVFALHTRAGLGGGLHFVPHIGTYDPLSFLEPFSFSFWVLQPQNSFSFSYESVESLKLVNMKDEFK